MTTESPVMDAESTMLYWLGQACRRAREEKGLSRVKVARHLNRDPSTLFRFEAGETWPDYIDRVLAGYAELTGLRDGRVLWAEACEALKRRNAD